MQVTVERLSQQFGNIKVLEDVSCSFPEGQITVLLGANGAGKTTLLRCLAGVSHGDKGAVLIDHARLETGRLDLRRRIAFLPDVPPTLPEADVLMHVAMYLRIWQADRPGIESQVAQWMEELQMSEHATRNCSALSRGQHYKASLLALLAVNPELWLLDEPFASGMDAQGISVFRREAQLAAKSGRTVIYSTQLVEQAANFSDRVAIVRHGGLQLYDTAQDFARDPAKIEACLMSIATT
jgi:ABC-type multidrug transport system ATPase subunit